MNKDLKQAIDNIIEDVEKNRCGYALIIKPDGEFYRVNPKGKIFSLKELQAMVEGYIEFAPYDMSLLFMVNEDGIAKNLPINDACNSLVGESFVGNVALVPVSLIE